MCRWFTIVSGLGLDTFWISSIWVAYSQLKVEENVIFLILLWTKMEPISHNAIRIIFMFFKTWTEVLPSDN